MTTSSNSLIPPVAWPDGMEYHHNHENVSPDVPKDENEQTPTDEPKQQIEPVKDEKTASVENELQDKLFQERSHGIMLKLENDRLSNELAEAKAELRNMNLLLEQDHAKDKKTDTLIESLMEKYLQEQRKWRDGE